MFLGFGNHFSPRVLGKTNLTEVRGKQMEASHQPTLLPLRSEMGSREVFAAS